MATLELTADEAAVVLASVNMLCSYPIAGEWVREQVYAINRKFTPEIADSLGADQLHHLAHLMIGRDSEDVEWRCSGCRGAFTKGQLERAEGKCPHCGGAEYVPYTIPRLGVMSGELS